MSLVTTTEPLRGDGIAGFGHGWSLLSQTFFFALMARWLSLKRSIDPIGMMSPWTARVVQTAGINLSGSIGAPSPRPKNEVSTPNPSNRPFGSASLYRCGFSAAAPQIYIVVMHSGVTLAPVVGRLAATEILDGVSVELLEPYRLERFATQ